MLTVRRGLAGLTLAGIALSGVACDSGAPPSAQSESAESESAEPESGESESADSGSGTSETSHDPAASDDRNRAAAPSGPDVGPDVPPLLPAIDDLDETVVTILTSDDVEVRVDAKVAAAHAERQRGLMEVESLPDGTGMLFLFEADQSGGFWMRNTLVPLDIAYVDADGVIGSILAMDPCEAEAAEDCEVYPPGHAYRTALEVPQSWFAEQGVMVGDRLIWTDPVPVA